MTPYFISERLMAVCRHLYLELMLIGPYISLRMSSVPALDSMRSSMLAFRLFGGGMSGEGRRQVLAKLLKSSRVKEAGIIKCCRLAGCIGSHFYNPKKLLGLNVHMRQFHLNTLGIVLSHQKMIKLVHKAASDRLYVREVDSRLSNLHILKILRKIPGRRP